MTEEAPRQHPALRSWTQLVATLLIFGGTVVWGAGEARSSQEAVARSVTDLASKVDKLSESVSRLSGANERLDEHIRGVDQRLNKLEQIEEWKRPR